jgi:pimeloyl-ACP methyl ester carboxylesterase
VILVDTRGTGVSQPRLGCPEFDRATESTFYSKPFIGSSAVEDFSRAITACRDRLTAAGIDLAAYDSAESAADLDALRRALGYRQWNLFAASADGALGLTYMRLFPDAIRSAVIDSGQSTQHLGGVDYQRGLNELLQRAFAGCAANAACNAAYPNLRDVFFDLVHRLQAHPAVIPIPDFEPNPVTIRVDGVLSTSTRSWRSSRATSSRPTRSGRCCRRSGAPPTASSPRSTGNGSAPGRWWTTPTAPSPGARRCPTSAAT